MEEPVRRWSPSTKRIVVVILLVLMALVVYRFRVVIPPLVIAFLVAFILDPVADWLTARLHISRGLATTIIFFLLILLAAGALAGMAIPVAAVPSAVERAIQSLQLDYESLITDIGRFLSRPLEIGTYTIDLSSVYQQLSEALRSFLGSVATGTLNVLFDIASGAFWLVFIVMASFYLVKDADRLVEQISTMAPPGYREDFTRLRLQITAVWNAFLRGQLLLCLAIAVLTTIVGLAIGLPYAPLLGLLAGVMEFLPNVGPFIAAVPAVLLALFRGSSVLPLSHFWFAVVVAGAYILVQQIENNLLVPRILGGSLKLHPLLVLIAIIVGGSLAGILGMLLAAPVLATLRVLARYVFCRLYDLDPFAEPLAAPRVKRPGLFKRAFRMGKHIIWRIRAQRAQKRPEEAASEGKDGPPPSAATNSSGAD